ncbi:prepilin-type N-terminal cleavage/methylation domain-containing protein [Clostridium sp. 19966]|uniref:prepilin-type N-terminal cleavage/methylation domain-containing protein n=1 Tax=Clostridium sp. 19966 TaxID=2768166 RepID=UPI0028DD8FD2|nr:prepilin-type N-terminal cleavage/methylation domain-containing protein [Clostridium sp. 19966]MDT8716596.1 prepilin-type N-terminal cleavage/methylation domain-containing protein [Clostridium sp. 19966]
MKFWNIDVIKHNTNKEKGFTLIECIIALSILTIVFLCIAKVFSHYSSLYGNYNISQKEESNVDEAFRIISSAVEKGNDEIRTASGTIRMHKVVESDDIVCFLHTEDNNLKFEHIVNGKKDGTGGLILERIANINIEQYSQTIYIEIVMETGNKYTKCLNANHQNVVEDM